jgi:hypothetical protein
MNETTIGRLVAEGAEMSAPIRYPRVQTVHESPLESPLLKLDHWHPVVRITYVEGDLPIDVCGDSWCTGACGLPAGVIPADVERGEEKVHSDMVAVGRMMQPFRRPWTGAKVEIPEQYRADFRKSWWK